jgi:amino acid adenylation domain-containing protein
MTELNDRLSSLSPAKRALLERLRTSQPAAPIPRIADGPAPLSAEQRRLWYVLQLAPGYPLYTIPMGFRLRGSVDAAALEAALGELVARHETLRTRFRESMGVPVQEVSDAPELRLEVIDVSRDEEWGEAEANYQTGAFARRTMDYARGEVFRALLVHEPGGVHRLLIGIHHLCADGWSATVLLRELSALYAAKVSGRTITLPPLPVRFRDWAAWQERGESGDRAGDEAYWRAELAGAPTALDLPADRPRPAVQGWAGAKYALDLPPGLSPALRALARREGATPYAVVAAAFGLVLARYTGQDDLLLGTLLANRPRPEVEGVVGFFANTVPLRLRFDGDPTAAGLVRRAHEVAVRAQEHAALPFDRIVELSGVRRDFARPPLVQAIVVHTEAAVSALALPGVEVEPLALDSSTALTELSLLVDDRGGTLSATLQYSTDLFDRETAGRMAYHLANALAAFASDPDRPISRISLADGDEQRMAAAFGLGPEPVEADDVLLPQLFERRAKEAPEKTAVVHESGDVTYAGLNRRANRIAHALRRRGAGPEARVAVCMERGPALIAAMLGVLKAGAAYVPLDPAHPPARHDAVLRQSGARLMVADAEAVAKRASASDGVEVLDAARLDGGRDDNPAPLAGPRNLAYVLFTSGSTGGPKGVEIEHRSAATVVGWMRGVLEEEERSAVLGSTSITFDVSVAEIFGTLCWGGTLVMVENALAAPPIGTEVRAAAMTPTAAAELLREGRFPLTVSTVLLGGEAVPLSLAQALNAHASVRRVLNLYGPTEDTTYSTCAELEPGAERVTVGRPVAGGRVYVLDAALAHAGLGVPGEVWTAGAGVARGYAGRPGFTAERFLPDPHGPPGARMYRTLDRGRWRGDGTLEYLGRGDAQVKVRGHRIELEEVEQALAAHPAVASAAAAAKGEGGGRKLVAYLVARPGVDRPEPAELRAWMRERLPEPFVPGAWVWMDALPRTTSGKLDRRALPDPDDAAASGVPYVDPRTPEEARLAAIWRDVLGVERVGVHDDFFDLGGQSILATRLVARVRAELGGEVAVATLLTGPTVAQMALALTAKPGGARRPLVALQTFGDRPPLFLAHPAGGHVVCYRALAVLLAMDQPVYALQPRGVEDGREPLDTVEAMASSYVEAIRDLRPEGPYRLGGWSFGGVIAWEMARQLDAAGAEVDLLALFDTAPLLPGLVKLDFGDPAEVIWHTVAGLAGYAAASRVEVDALRGVDDPHEMALTMIRTMAAPHLLPEHRAADVVALTAVRAANLRAQAAYRAEAYRGRLTYFRTEGSDDERGESPGLEFWSALALGGTEVHRVTGNHGTILHEPHVHVLAEALLKAGAS